MVMMWFEHHKSGGKNCILQENIPVVVLPNVQMWTMNLPINIYGGMQDRRSWFGPS